MDLKTAICQRRSIRGFTDRPVERETLRQVLTLAGRAVSAVNAQPWEFAVVTGTALDAIRREYMERLERNASDYQADVDFHINLAYASHNMIFATMLDYINYMILDLRLRYFERSDYHGKTKEAHRRIYEAVKARDADRAAYEMDRHLSIIEDYYDNENADAEQKNS